MAENGLNVEIRKSAIIQDGVDKLYERTMSGLHSNGAGRLLWWHRNGAGGLPR